MIKNSLVLVQPNVVDIRKFRKSILYKCLPKSFAIYKEDFLEETKHFGLISNYKLVSILSLMKKTYEKKRNFKSIQIRGFATKNGYQKKGYGSYLIQKVIKEIIKKQQIEIVWCNARKETLDFYVKNSFVRDSNYFYINKIGLHQKLYYDCRKKIN